MAPIEKKAATKKTTAKRPAPKSKTKVKAKAKSKAKAKGAPRKTAGARKTAAKPRQKKEKSPEWEAAKAEQHRLKRLAILRAAAQTLTERGYHGASLTDVGKRLGMTNGALYYYFKNKQEMAYECLLATQEQTKLCLEKADTEEETGLGKVEAFIRNIIVETNDNPTWVQPGEPFFLTAAMRKDVRKATAANHATLAHFIEAGVKDRSIGLCEPKTTALLILGSLVFLHNWVPNITNTPPERISEIAASFVSKSLKPTFRR